MKAVLLAVGLGERRVRPAWRAYHAPESSVERPPVDRAIEAFARAGFEEVAVVVGHSEDVLWRYLEDGGRYGITVYCLHNAQYQRGSATSIYAARAFVGGEPFVVSLCSYPVNANMLLKLQAQSCGQHGVCVNQVRRRKESNEAMKVRFDAQGRVGQVGRRLKRWQASSTGTFLFQPDVFGYITALLVRGDDDCSISALLQHMIDGGEAPYACDVSPLWDGVTGGEELLVWTAPMLTVAFSGAVGGAMTN